MRNYIYIYLKKTPLIYRPRGRQLGFLEDDGIRGGPSWCPPFYEGPSLDRFSWFAFHRLRTSQLLAGLLGSAVSFHRKPIITRFIDVVVSTFQLLAIFFLIIIIIIIGVYLHKLAFKNELQCVYNNWSKKLQKYAETIWIISKRHKLQNKLEILKTLWLYNLLML